MSDEEAAERMKDFCTGDKESDHQRADTLLCALLAELGYIKTVRAFVELDKWYA